MQNRIGFRRATALTAVVLIWACLTPCAGRTKTSGSVGSASAKANQLAADIDRQSNEIARTLSPTARQAMQTSLSRFYQWVAGYCGVPDSLKDSSGDNLRCVQNQYFNYLDHVPRSVYRAGRWTVYETAAYGLLWADGDLLELDPARPFTWDLQVNWPHVDAEPSPLSRKMNWALQERVHSLVSGWAVSGWEVIVSVRIETINTCYASVGIEQSVYSGGAHGNGKFESFNWNRTSDAPLSLADLFKPGIDWRHNIVTLYEKHLRSGDGGVRPSILDDQPFLTEESLERSIDKDTVVTDHGLKIVVGGLAPAYGFFLPGIELKRVELEPWLVPSAPCTSADTWPVSP